MTTALPNDLDIRAARPDQYVAGATGDWEIIVGLEVHAQLLTRSKAYSSDANEYGASPNSLLSRHSLQMRLKES